MFIKKIMRCSTCKLKDKGDYFAHSQILENYENIIKAYKEKIDR